MHFQPIILDTNKEKVKSRVLNTPFRFHLQCRKVYVDHDPSVSSAKKISDTLNEEGFGAHVLQDHAVFSTPTSAFVISMFSVSPIDNDSVERLRIFLSSPP